jgi:hypothetical protein
MEFEKINDPELKLLADKLGAILYTLSGKPTPSTGPVPCTDAGAATDTGADADAETGTENRN